MKYVFIPVALLLFIMIFVNCGSKTTSPIVNPAVSGSGSRITLDTASALSSAVTIQAHSGATLTIDSGTKVLMSDSGVFQPVPAGDTLLVALDDGDSSAAAAISGLHTVARFRISATVNGNTAELLFISPGSAPAPGGMPVTGAHWSALLSDTAIHAGAEISLYKIAGSGTYTLIGSQVFGVPTRVLPKAAAGSGQQTTVGPDGTGSFQTGVDQPSAPSSNATIPSGVYWNTYTNTSDTSYDVDGVTVGGPLTVSMAELGEQSTGESIALFSFAPGVTCVTTTNARDGTQYWAELTQTAAGKTTSVKIAATVANIFGLNLNLVSVSDRTPILQTSNLSPDGSGVHAPDGSVIADPYQNSSLKIEGFKLINVMVKNRNDGDKVLGWFTGAGYNASDTRFDKNVYQFMVNFTLDGRKLFEEKILQPKGWFPVEGSATWRNRGLYVNNDSLFINISSHGVKDSVKTMHQTLTGTFTNAAGEPDTVKRMTVVWTNLGKTKTAEATMGDNGTSFSVDCDLYTGDNLFIFQPYVMDNSGNETYQLHTILKAKAVRTKLFVINYKEHRNGVLIIHTVTTTYTNDPDTAMSINDATVTANLTMTPNQVVLLDIQTSASSASTCASSQSCSILDGVSDSSQTVTVSEQYQMSSRNCDHNLPLLDMEHWNGSMSFSNYGLARVHATLLPPGTGANRQYSLTVDIRPTLQMMSTPNKAGQGEYFDCFVDSTWKPEAIDIFPHITLTKSDNPPVLQFGSAATLERYVAAPDSGGSWMFRGTKYSADSMSVTQYDATLTVSP